jgi:hypothetical protein
VELTESLIKSLAIKRRSWSWSVIANLQTIIIAVSIILLSWLGSLHVCTQTTIHTSSTHVTIITASHMSELFLLCNMRTHWPIKRIVGRLSKFIWGVTLVYNSSEPWVWGLLVLLTLFIIWGVALMVRSRVLTGGLLLSVNIFVLFLLPSLSDKIFSHLSNMRVNLFQF